MYYNTYRPRHFRDVLGQPGATYLRKSADGKRTPSAILLTGGRGRGKTTLARLTARAVNCYDLQDGEPCGKCRACKSPDFWWEQDAGAYGTASEMRKLKNYLSAMPHHKKQVVLIEEAHGLSDKAQMGLLKILEEPPEDSIVILTTTNPEKLKDALKSRCVWLPIYGVSKDLVIKHLRHVSKLEGVKLHPDAARVIARMSNGSVRDALSQLEALAGYNKPITEKLALWCLQIVKVDGLVSYILDNNLPKALMEIEKLSDKYDAKPILVETSRVLMDVARDEFDGNTKFAYRLAMTAASLHRERNEVVISESAHLTVSLITAMVGEQLGLNKPEEVEPVVEVGTTLWDTFVENLRQWVAAGIYPRHIYAEAELLENVNYNKLARRLTYTGDKASDDLKMAFAESEDLFDIEWRHEHGRNKPVRRIRRKTRGTRKKKG